MSTILKALRRLEEDRNLVADRPLREAVATPLPEEKPSRKGHLLLLSTLGIGVAVGAGALAFLSVRGADPPPALAVAPSSPPARPAPVATSRVAAAELATAVAPPEPARSRGAEVRLLADDGDEAVAIALPPPAPAPEPTRELSPAALASEVKVLKRPTAAPRIADPDIEAEAATPQTVAAAVPAAPAPAPAEPPAVSARRSEPRVSEAPPPPVAQIARQERSEPPPPPARTVASKPDPAPKPDVTEKPASPSSKRLAQVRVEETRWHPDAARRTAVVEMEAGAGTREVHEGDALGSLVVSKIEPSGVVFQHGDTEVRRKIGQ